MSQSETKSINSVSGKCSASNVKVFPYVRRLIPPKPNDRITSMVRIGRYNRAFVTSYHRRHSFEHI